MNPDDVFALLVDADPWPDPEAAAAAVLPRTTSTSEWSTRMRTIEPDVELTPDEPPTHQPRGRWLAAAAAVIGIAVVVATFAIRADSEPAEPADEPTAPVATREAQAVATGLAFYTAVTSGDVDTVMAMSDPELTNVEADRAMWEMNAVASAGNSNFTITSCTAANVKTGYIEVDCAATADSPIWKAMGISDLIVPAQVFDDQRVRWLSFRGDSIGPAVMATVEYLQAFHREEYDAVCSPTAYEPGTITSVLTLALTPECAELWVPIDDDIAQWILDGRPTP